jgi:membrane-bound lytic murein transglycosylase MltF
LKRAFFSFLILFFFAISLGIGIYFITDVRLYLKKGEEIAISQSGMDEDMEVIWAFKNVGMRGETKIHPPLSKYDSIIKKYAQQYEFDWRFVASIIFQETKFVAGLTGKGGSYGLMQLMPVVMEHYGISENDGEEANIRAGVQHLNTIRAYFDDITDENEKYYFIAAAYNAGRGHIFDAQRLCVKNDEDHKKWANVAKYLKLKTRKEIIEDTEVKFGYLQGARTVKYAQQVMDRFFVYKAAYP